MRNKTKKRETLKWNLHAHNETFQSYSSSSRLKTMTVIGMVNMFLHKMSLAILGIRIFEYVRRVSASIHIMNESTKPSLLVPV